MGFSVPLTHMIVVIAAVSLASVFSAYAVYTGNTVQNELAQKISDTKRTVNLQLEVVHATVDKSTTPPHFKVYVKNVGSLPLNDFRYLDVYVGGYGEAQLFSYNASATPGSGDFNITDANGDGVWEPRETLTIQAYPQTYSDETIFECKVAPFRGIGSSYLFTTTP